MLALFLSLLNISGQALLNLYILCFTSPTINKFELSFDIALKITFCKLFVSWYSSINISSNFKDIDLARGVFLPSLISNFITKCAISEKLKDDILFFSSIIFLSNLLTTSNKVVSIAFIFSFSSSYKLSLTNISSFSFFFISSLNSSLITLYLTNAASSLCPFGVLKVSNDILLINDAKESKSDKHKNSFM